MDKLIVPTLIINLLSFIVSVVLGLNSGLISGSVSGGYSYQLQLALGAAALISVVILITVPLGVRVLGSGFSDAGAMIIIRATVYSITWAVLSSGTWTLLHQIPYGFGDIIFAILSIAYAFGVFMSLGAVGGDRGSNAADGSTATGGE